MKTLTILALLAIVLAVMAQPARAFNHPSIPNNTAELHTIKANLDKQPWKSGYAALAADGKSQLTYGMAGPFETVSRNPNLNLWPWRNDMSAINNLARMWVFTGNPDYAQKAHDILIAWANTHTNFGGQESGLDIGDYAMAFVGGADILRGTWPGWTQHDTVTVQNYFKNVYWPKTTAPYKVSGPANKGSLSLLAGTAIAVFCDDPGMFNHVVDTFRSYPGAGLPNILATGQMGETGRDWGHGYNDLLARTLTAEILWEQGIDVFSELDNRLLAAGEYHARNTSSFDTPFVPYGTIDYHYYQNAGGLNSQDRTAYYLLQNAYKHRLGLPTPWIDRKIAEVGVHGGNFMFARTCDFSIATPLPADTRPAVGLASSGLTLTTLGTQTAGRSASYSNGVWTVTGLGGGIWTDGFDDSQFLYRAMTGDCAMVAKVTSLTFSGSQNGKMGLMIRDNLAGNVSQRSWIGIVPTSTGGNLIEARSTGWTVNWGGSNWARRSQGLPLPLPYWLKIERKGTVVTSYASQDGTSWSPTISSDFGNLPPTVHVGIHVSSGNSTPNTATFENVAFTGGTGGLVTTPAAPAAMLASGSNKGITVRWLPSFGATSYDLLRSTTSGSGYTVIAANLDTGKTSHEDMTASAGTTYYYVARAKNSAGTSANSPQSGASRISPQLINLAFSGGTTDVPSAFDDNFGSFWFHVGTTGSLQYDFGANSAQVIKRYTMASAPLLPERDPKNWQFQGSNDGATWITLDTQANQTFEWRGHLRAFDIANTTAYRYFRLKVTANNGSPDFLHLSELGLWGDTGRTVPDGRYVLASRKTNKVMDVAHTANGAQVVQQSFAGDDAQQWTLAWQGDDVYRVTNGAAAKVLDNGGTSATGANLEVQPSNEKNNQLWKITSEGDGFFRIASANSGLVADVDSGSTADGASIVQSAYTGANSQQWRVAMAVAPLPPPAAPTGMAASAASISQINLTWTGSSGAISYQVKRSLTSGGPYTAVSVPVNGTSYSDTDLLSSTTYYYVVSAINGSGESADSAQAGATTLTAPPDAPTSTTAILGTARVTLSWAASGGATGYSVLRATSSGGPYIIIASGVTGTTYADTSISPNATYYYKIVATNANGTSPTSPEITVGSGTVAAHLKFDETGGTIATDSSGRGQNATLVNGANFAAPGIVESGLNLPATGAAQHATLPSGIASGLTDFTIATWIKVNAFSTWARIFDFGNSTSNTMFLAAQGPAGAGRPRFSIRTATVAEQYIDSTVALTAGAWTHVAVTRSGTTVRIYINGVLAGTGTATLSPTDLGFTTENYLGKSRFPDPALNATLDEFRVHASALSQSEVAALATPAAGSPTRVVAIPGDTEATVTWLPNATNSHTFTVKRSTRSGGPYITIATGVTGLSYTDSGLTNGTVYYYVVSAANGQDSTPDSAEASVNPNALAVHLKFDESSGGIAADSSGRAFHATLVNGMNFAPGKLNNAVSFTAGSSQYATLPSGVVSGMGDFSVSTWINVNAFATWQRVFDFGTGTNNFMFLTTQYGTGGSAAKLRFGIRTPSVGEQNVSGTAVAVTAGTWTHVAVIRSGTTVSLYVNGAIAGSGTIVLSPADLGVTTLNYLGKSQFNDPYLNATLDDFRLYSRALSAPELTSLVSPLAAPQNVSATPGPLSLSLSWNAVPDATSYTLKYSVVSGGPYTPLASGPSTTGHVHSGLTYGTTYYYVVSAGNSTYESPVSTELMATPDPALISGEERAAPSFTLTPAAGENPAIATLKTASSVAGHSYQLQTSSSLATDSWQNVGDPVSGDGTPIVLEVPYGPAEPHLFYRFVVTR